MVILNRFLRFFFHHLYHSLAWTYDVVAWLVSLGQWKQWVYAASPLIIGTTILEIGHGPGHLLVYLAKRGQILYGLDESKNMGFLARKNWRRAFAESNPPLHSRLARGLSQSLPFRGGFFQTVIATFPSEYIFHLDTLAEVHRILTPTGQLVILFSASINGKTIFERFAAFLFKITAQSIDANAGLDKYLRPFTLAGFQVKIQRIDYAASSLLFVIAQPAQISLE